MSSTTPILWSERIKGKQNPKSNLIPNNENTTNDMPLMTANTTNDMPLMTANNKLKSNGKNAVNTSVSAGQTYAPSAGSTASPTHDVPSASPSHDVPSHVPSHVSAAAGGPVPSPVSLLVNPKPSSSLNDQLLKKVFFRVFMPTFLGEQILESFKSGKSCFK